MTTFNILLYGGFLLIISGVILFVISHLMVKYYEKQINKHTFEILRPKIKRKK